MSKTFDEVLKNQPNAREDIMKLLNGAISNINQSGIIALQKNEMAADLEVFKKLKGIQSQLTDCMREISRVRGL